MSEDNPQRPVVKPSLFGRKERVLLITIVWLLLVAIVLLIRCLWYDHSMRKPPTEAHPSPTPSLQGISAVPLPPAHARLTQNGFAFQKPHFQVAEGNVDAAKKYYSATVSPQLNFLSPADIVTSSLKDLLEYFGYANIPPKDLHRLPSDEIMKLSAPGDILATRFFAPKITAVSANPPQIPASGFGWRKLVSFKAKTGSKAADNGMGLLLLLQNIFEPTVAGDPFNVDRNVSRFNQVIVTRKSGPFTQDKQPAYFFAYGELVKVDPQGLPVKDAAGNFLDDGRISFSLRATFDEKARDPETNVTARDYFVPDSCRQCHGKILLTAKTNYLDTDHWIDRVTPDYGLSDPKFKEEDFTALASSPYDVIYDGQKDPARFQNAFDVLRQLNEQIRDQNQQVGGNNNFQLNAVNCWLDLHSPDKFGTKHVPPYQRGFGNQLWDATDMRQRAILYYLNRYCYRCHSSVRYNVFDREAVLNQDIRSHVLEVTDSSSWMPQDRIFPGLQINQNTGEGIPTGNLKEFLDLLDQIHP